MNPGWLSGRCAARVVLAASLCAGSLQAAAQSPIVVGMSMSFSSASELNAGRTERMKVGVLSYLGRINAEGGIAGRRIELVLADDQGVPERHVQNLRKMVQEQGAVALIGCDTDAICKGAAETATALKVPLIGLQSGLPELTRQKYPYAFRVRADYKREAEVLARQLSQLACFNVALLTDSVGDSATDMALRDAATRQGLKLRTLPIKSTERAALEAVIEQVGKGGFHCSVMNLRTETLGRLIDEELSERPEWPLVLITVANGNLAPLVAYFKKRTVGYTQVVPHPELLARPLARDLDNDAKKYGSGLAYTFDGMEGYVSARLLVEALRKAGPSASPQRLAAVLEAPEGWNIGGFSVNFGPGRANGSDWVELGVRSRAGVLVN